MLYWEHCIRSDVNDCAVSQGQGTSESCDSSMFSSSQEKEAVNKVINCNWIVMLYSMPSLTTMVYFEETQNRLEVPETVMLRKHEISWGIIHSGSPVTWCGPYKSLAAGD